MSKKEKKELLIALKIARGHTWRAAKKIANFGTYETDHLLKVIVEAHRDLFEYSQKLARKK